MSEYGSPLFRPGTIFLFVMIALMGLGMYTWANTSIGNASQESFEDQSQAISCSGLDISLEDVDSSSNTTEVFFQSNRDLEKVQVKFDGSRQVNVTLGDVRSGDIRNASANVSNFSSVSFKAVSCGQIFRYE